MRESSTRTTAGATRVWMRSLLVVGEVALAVTLVVGAGLLIRSFMNLTRVDMGFNRAELSTFGLVLPGARYNPQQRVDFYDRLSAKLSAVPGVQRVAAMSGLPPLRNVNANDTDFEHIPNNRRRRADRRPSRRTWTSGSSSRSATPRRWEFRSSRDARSSRPTSAARRRCS